MLRRPAPLSAKEVKGGFAPFHEIRVEPRLPCAPNPREGIRGFFDAAAAHGFMSQSPAFYNKR